MKTFLLVLFLIVLAVLTFVFLHQDPGSVQITFRGNTFAAPLVYVFYGVLAAFIALYILLRIVGMLFRAPTSLGKASARRAQDAAAQRLVTGSLDLAEGQLARAEKTLVKDVPDGPIGTLHYLAAAEAAQGLDRPEYHERYLQRAVEHHAGAKFGIDLNKAQKALESGAATEALETSRSLVKAQSRNPRALALLAQSLAANGEWKELYSQLPDLRKHSSLTKQQLAKLDLDAAAAIVANADEQELESSWRGLSAEARNDTDLLSKYAKRLQAAGKGEAAEITLRNALEQEWKPSLVAAYGAIDGANAEQQVGQLQKWIEAHGESADLLAAAGQISVRQELWGKAHSYLEQAAELGDNPTIQHALSLIAQNKGDIEASRNHLERGLSLALNS